MEYLLKVSSLIAIFYVVYKVFLQRDTFFKSNRGFLLLGLITSFIIPFLVIPVYIEQATTLVPNYIFSDPLPVEKAENPFNILDYLPIVYVAGTLFFFIRFAIQLISLFTLIFKNKSEKQGIFTFVKVNTNISPFSFFKWIVYNPNQFNKTELDQIITHEKVHVQQYHSLDILLTQLSCIILWFNPFMWLYNKDLKQNLEFLADNSAINTIKSKKDYQYTLLKTSLPTHQLALSNNFYNSLIKKRIVMLHKSKSKKINQIKFAIVIPLLVIFLMSFNTEKVYVTQIKALEDTVNKEAIKETSLIKNPAPSSTKNKGYIETEIVQLTKNFTDTDLENLASKLKKKGITIKFKGIKRNSAGEITAIKINVSSKDSNANYNISNDDPIKPIKISFEDDGKNISIGTGNAIYRHKISDKDAHEDVDVFIEKDIDVHEDIYEDVDVIIEKDKSVHEDVDLIIEKDEDANHEEDYILLKSTGNGKSYDVKRKKSGKIIITSGDDTEPLYIIDSKEIKKEEFEKLNPESIESVTVLKGKNASKIHGEKGENGVVLISTKEKKNVNTILKGILSDIPPLYVLNGKQIKEKKFNSLNRDHIESINVLKGESAIKKYGDKGKNGVIEISTKKE